jgi:dimethylargininase
MHVFDFNRALVRTPSRSVTQGLSAIDRGRPSFDGIAREHRAYVRALEDAGVTVDVLPPLEAYPDSIFVEDTALVFQNAAILLRPGAPSRSGETAEIAPALKARFANALYLTEGTVDGGDVLNTPRGVFIGRSARTSAEGAAALTALLDRIGLKGIAVTTPPGVLHFKSDCSLLDDTTILATSGLAASGVFEGFRVLLTPDGEEAAANAVRVNDRVLLGDAYPRTADLLAKAGYKLTPLPTREIAKIDAGLSCMSLRWREAVKS